MGACKHIHPTRAVLSEFVHTASHPVHPSACLVRSGSPAPSTLPPDPPPIALVCAVPRSSNRITTSRLSAGVWMYEQAALVSATVDRAARARRIDRPFPPASRRCESARAGPCDLRGARGGGSGRRGGTAGRGGEGGASGGGAHSPRMRTARGAFRGGAARRVRGDFAAAHANGARERGVVAVAWSSARARRNERPADQRRW